MQSLSTAIAAQNPAYLGERLSPRYAQVRAKLLVGAQALLRIEYQSALKVSKSKRLLRRLHELDHLRRRLRFLSKTLGEPLGEEAYALIAREEHFRKARFKLRRLRKLAKNDKVDSWDLKELRDEMRRGGLTNRDIRTTARELKSIEMMTERRAERLRQRRLEQRWQREEARQQRLEQHGGGIQQ